ncbi:MAG TPA: AraC family transcriptional regulator [Burkholderiaceae bacterium]|nr:AraC family transcriptional regulator [Burkholderiaceae bacterium]
MVLPAVLRELGVEPDSVIASAGVDPRAFDDGSRRVSLQRVGLLLRACIDATGEPNFGLLVASRFELPMLGVLGYLVRNQPTVRAALRTLALQLHLQDRGAVAGLKEDGSRPARLSYAVCTPQTPETGLICSSAIMIAFRLMKALCGPTWRPVEVRIAQAILNDARAYREMFESSVRFDAPLTELVFESRWLDRPVAGADPQLLRVLNGLLATIESQSKMTLAEQVRRVLRTAVLAGTANARSIADIFSLSERGLRRHLAREGVSLNELIAEVRLLVSQQLIEQTRLPLSEVAAALHYSDSSALTRAFRGWTGMAPREWRRQNGGQNGNGESPRRSEGPVIARHAARAGTQPDTPHGRTTPR